MNTIINELNKQSFIIAPIFYKLLFMSVTALCIGAVIMLIRRFADGKISPIWKYAMWMIVIIALVIPYKPETEFALLNNVADLQEISYRDEYDRVRSQQHELIFEQQPVPEQQTDLDQLEKEVQTVFLKSLIFDVAVPLIWLSGVIFIALIMFIFRIRLSYKLKQNRHKTDPRHIALLQKSKATLKIKGEIELITQDYINSPAILGIVRPKIILPLYVSEMDDESVKYIMLHELSHYKRLDMLLNYLLLVLQTVYWFNPLVWIMFRFIRQDMELANDAYILGYIGNESSKEYSRSLVEVLSHYNEVSFAPKLLCMVDGKGNMQRRIKMIKLGESFKKHRILIAVLSIAIICVISALFLTQSSSSRDSIKWAKKLSAGDIQSIELVVMPSEENQRYRLFSSSEFEDVVALINQSSGRYQKNPEQLDGGMTAFYVTTKDGLRHTVINIGNAQLIIDGDYYDAKYHWLSSWKYNRGNAPLPEGFSFDYNADAEKIWKHRTKYIGDNSSVGNIIHGLGFPQGVTYDSFELFTNEHPYAVYINLKTDTETRDFYSGAVNQEPFYKLAMTMFCLIENAEYITFSLDDGKNPFTIDYTSDMAVYTLGFDYFAESKTLSGFIGLLNRIHAGRDSNQANSIISNGDLDSAISKAILEVKKGRYAKGNFATEAHSVLASEAAGPASSSKIEYVTQYVRVRYMEFGYSGGGLSEVSGGMGIDAIVFEVTENGLYKFLEYWEGTKDEFIPLTANAKHKPTQSPSKFIPLPTVQSC